MRPSMDSESELLDQTNSSAVILRKTTSLPDLGTETNPIVIEEDSQSGSELNPIVIYFDEDHSSSPNEQLQTDLETELIATPEPWWERMFRESDELLADEDIDSDFLLPLECQQVGLADKDAAVTRGISPDCLFRASIEISPDKDSFPDQLECYGSMHNGNKATLENKYAVETETGDFATQTKAIDKLPHQDSVFFYNMPRLEKRKRVNDEENQQSHGLIKRERHEHIH